MMLNTIPISKADAAKDELTAALEMFMDYKHPLSVHVLAYSAHALLDAMAHATSQGMTISQLIRPDLSKKKKKMLHDKLNASYNFLKHAGRDFNKNFDFNPEQTEWVLLWTVNLFYDVMGYKTALMGCFQLWMCKEHPEISWDLMTETLESGNHPAFSTKDRRAYKDLIPYFPNIIPK